MGDVPLGLVDPGVGSGLHTGNRREPFISLFPLKAAHAGRNTTVGSYRVSLRKEHLARSWLFSRSRLGLYMAPGDPVRQTDPLHSGWWLHAWLLLLP